MTSLRTALVVARHSVSQAFEEHRSRYEFRFADEEVNKPLRADRIVNLRLWENQLNVPQTTTTSRPEAIPLEDIHPIFSFSDYLSPMPYLTKNESLRISHSDKPLDAVHLSLLALNEECRQLECGCFYHLPLRGDATKGHPSDLVFVDEPWDDIDTKTWDALDWAGRLELCDAGELFAFASLL